MRMKKTSRLLPADKLRTTFLENKALKLRLHCFL